MESTGSSRPGAPHATRRRLPPDLSGSRARPPAASFHPGDPAMRQPRFFPSAPAFLAAAALALAARPASAQYFGQNKVQYKKFDYEVLKPEPFDIHFSPEERAAAQDAARMAERWYSRLSRVMNHQLRDRQPIILYASPTDFQQTNVVSGGLGEGTGGVTQALNRRLPPPLPPPPPP